MNEQLQPTNERQSDFYEKLDKLLSQLQAAREADRARLQEDRFIPHIHPQAQRPNQQTLLHERAVVEHVIDNDRGLSFDNQQRLLEAFELCTPIASEKEYLEQSQLAAGQKLKTPFGEHEIVESKALFQLIGPENEPDLRVTAEVVLADGSKYLVVLKGVELINTMRLN